jgi:rubrerythrin
MADLANRLVSLLNEAMSMEYGAIFLLPQHIAQLDDENLKAELRAITEMEVEHAEKTAEMIFALGAFPKADLPTLRVETDLTRILETHIEGEQNAIGLYARAAADMPSAEMRETLDQLRKDEESHLLILQRALRRIGGDEMEPREEDRFAA